MATAVYWLTQDTQRMLESVIGTDAMALRTACIMARKYFNAHPEADGATWLSFLCERMNAGYSGGSADVILASEGATKVLLANALLTDIQTWPKRQRDEWRAWYKEDLTSDPDIGAWLRRARSMSPAEYHKTVWWRWLKRRYIEAYGAKCQLCTERDGPFHLHHKHYRTVGCETFDDVILLCQGCHERRHGKRHW